MHRKVAVLVCACDAVRALQMMPMEELQEKLVEEETLSMHNEQKFQNEENLTTISVLFF